MSIELNILDWFQTLHTPFLDKLMVFITSLGNAGIIWIVMTIVFLLIPKMRKTGAVMTAALIIDLLLCNVILKNLVARTRPYDVNTGVQLLVSRLHDYSFPSGHTAAAFASVTHRCSWRSPGRRYIRISGISVHPDHFLQNKTKEGGLCQK